MIAHARIRLLLLALMVAASHVALISHVAAHFQPQLEQCELCVSQAQPLAAVPIPQQAPMLLNEPRSIPCLPAAGPLVRAVWQTHRQRAPPLPSP